MYSNVGTRLVRQFLLRASVRTSPSRRSEVTREKRKGSTILTLREGGDVNRWPGGIILVLPSNDGVQRKDAGLFQTEALALS